MTKTDAKYHRLAMPCPFAAGTGGSFTPINTTGGQNDVNFPEGFATAYGVPVSRNGKLVTRLEMNAIGNLASQNQFYFLSGGINTFDATFANLIGGYPQDAVLDYLHEEKLYKVISLVDDNLVDFTSVGVDDVNWTVSGAYDDTTPKNVLFTVPSVTTGYNGYEGNSLVIANCTPIGYAHGVNGMLVFGGEITATNTGTRSISGTNVDADAYGFCVVCIEADDESTLAARSPLTYQGTCIYYNGKSYNLYTGDSSSPTVVYSGGAFVKVVGSKYYSFWLCSANTTISSSTQYAFLRG